MHGRGVLVAVALAGALIVPGVPASAAGVELSPVLPVPALTAPNQVRLYDSRSSGVTVDGQGVGAGMLSPNVARSITVVGRAGVVAGSAGVVLNATVVGATKAGVLRLYPCTKPVPTVTTLSFSPGSATANTAIIGLGGDQLCAAATSGTHLILDLVTQFTAGSGFTAKPARLINTATGYGGQRLAAGTWTRLAVGGGTRSVALNVTASGVAARGFVAVASCLSTDPPKHSTLNVRPGVAVSNLVTAVQRNDVCAYASVATDLTVDLVGVLPNTWLSTAVEITEAERQVDSRTESQYSLRAGVTVRFQPRLQLYYDDLAMVNLTALGGHGGGNLTAFACRAVPATSTMPVGGAPVAHFTLAPLDTLGGFCLRSTVDTQVLIDVAGSWKAEGAPLRVGFWNCGSAINPAEWGIGDGVYFNITGGVGPYTVDATVPAGWSVDVSLPTEDFGIDNVLLMVTHPVLAYGSYPVTLVVTDANLATVTVTLMVQVPYLPTSC